MQKINFPTRRVFWLVTYAIVLFVALQRLDVVKSLIGWLFTVLEPLLFGLCAAFIINLFMNIFQRKVFYRMAASENKVASKLCRPLCALSTFFVAAAMIMLVIFLIIPQVSTAVNTLLEKAPESSVQLREMAIAKLSAWHAPAFLIEEVNAIELDWSKVAGFLSNVLDGKVETVLGTAFSATASVVSSLTNFLLGVIIAVYILAKKERFLFFMRRILILIFPEQYRAQCFRVLRLANQSFANFITGQFVEAIIIGSLCTIGLSIFQFPYAAAIGVLVGITALIPILGAWIGGAIGLLLVWVAEPDRAFWFLVFIFALQQIEGQFIYPKVVGDSLGLPGVVVLLAVILGGSFGGIVGILLAVPVSGILYTLLKEMIDRMPNDPPLQPAAAVPTGTVATPELPSPAETEPAPATVPAPTPAPPKHPRKQRRHK